MEARMLGREEGGVAGERERRGSVWGMKRKEVTKEGRDGGEKAKKGTTPPTKMEQKE
jgi:hypothetical protein